MKESKWVLVFMLDGPSRVPLVLSSRLMPATLDRMSIWPADSKQLPNTMGFQCSSAAIFTKSWPTRTNKDWDTLTGFKSSPARDQWIYIQSIFQLRIYWKKGVSTKKKRFLCYKRRKQKCITIWTRTNF